ncbi:DUF2567 domain-containing protein [Nocardia terpenica]|uniref:DUF2567 domain-containing protein n=1 Tax=Nocardia terpenica TaxID=455432 RepID=A0A6G9Z1B0_9NOCA|nr:DUF2567 domain-containing protein [Nocardia terpenica]QIS19171.1 DUF2567 domain-containing protein [Nocardia terpenica]
MAHQHIVERVVAGRRELRAVASVTAAVLLVSVLAGGAWALLAPTEKVLVVRPGYGAPLIGESAHQFDAVAIFVGIGAVTGVLSAAAAWRLRRARGPMLQGGLLIGSLAGAWLMARAGERMAAWMHPPTPHAPLRSVVELAPTVAGWPALLVQPLLAGLVVLVLAALSPSDDLGTGLGAPPPDSADGARPYSSEVTYGPYGSPVSGGAGIGRSGPLEGAESGPGH